MDRLIKYQTILEKYLLEVADFYRQPDQDTSFDLLSSYRNRHFQLVEYGHTPDEWIYSLFMHFHIDSHGKVILLANNTEQEPFVELIEAGIEENDLVVGWVPLEIQSLLEKQTA